MRKILLVAALILSPAIASAEIVHTIDMNTGNIEPYNVDRSGKMVVLTPFDGGLPVIITK